MSTPVYILPRLTLHTLLEQPKLIGAHLMGVNSVFAMLPLLCRHALDIANVTIGYRLKIGVFVEITSLTDNEICDVYSVYVIFPRSVGACLVNIVYNYVHLCKGLFLRPLLRV